jgi:hypothetical protein
MSAQGLAVFFESVTVELFPIVNSQFSRNSKSADYVLTEELLNCRCPDVREWFCFHPFREIVLLTDKRRIPLRSASVRTPHLFHHGIPKVLVNPRSKGITSV